MAAASNAPRATHACAHPAAIVVVALNGMMGDRDSLLKTVDVERLVGGFEHDNLRVHADDSKRPRRRGAGCQLC